MHICSKVRQSLHDYAMGQLNTDELGEIQAHLDECDECRRLYETEKLYCENIPHIANALCRLPAGKNLADSVTSQIEQEKLNPPVYVSRRRFPFATAAAAVVIMLALVFANRAGLTENYMQKSDDSADMISSITNTASDYEYTDEDMRIYADGIHQASPEEVTDEALSEEIFFDTTESAEPSVENPDSETKTKFYMMASTPPASVGAAINSAVTESVSTDDATAEPDENDPAFTAHKSIAKYNDFIASNAIIPLYPQVILHGGDSGFYYDNFVRNNTGKTLIEGENFYCLHMSAENLIKALKICGITDYTVIQPENPLNDDMVYIWYK